MAIKIVTDYLVLYPNNLRSYERKKKPPARIFFYISYTVVYTLLFPCIYNYILMSENFTVHFFFGTSFCFGSPFFSFGSPFFCLGYLSFSQQISLPSPWQPSF